jgi:hypothetical protein
VIVPCPSDGLENGNGLSVLRADVRVAPIGGVASNVKRSAIQVIIQEKGR